MENEIIIYQDENTSTKIEVRLEDETVWLNRHQLALLFNRDIKTVGKHIANALKEELTDISVVANFATTASDGKVYNVEHYNLDMILSIGYRVKIKSRYTIPTMGKQSSKRLSTKRLCNKPTR